MVLEEIPPNCTVVGVPGRVVKRYDTTLNREVLNQIDLPDPVRDDIDQLQRSNAELTNHLIELEDEVRQLQMELQFERKEKNRLAMDRAQTEGVNGDGI